MTSADRAVAFLLRLVGEIYPEALKILWKTFRELSIDTDNVLIQKTFETKVSG